MWERKYIIWSNENLDTEDWKESFKEFIEKNNLDIDPNDEEKLHKYMVETNDEYLSDERINLNINVPDTDTVLVIADLEFWDGRCSAYREIHADKISDCLYTDPDTDYTTWYLDNRGDFCCDQIHHDGTNHLCFRAYKPNMTEAQKENLKAKLYMDTATRADITRVTQRLGDEIAKVYGWDIPKSKTESENDFDMPLFNKELSREEFDRKVRENPINDHLKVSVLPAKEKAVTGENKAQNDTETEQNFAPNTSYNDAFFLDDESQTVTWIYYNPDRGEYNLYCYCYRRDWLDQHLKDAEKGIRFIDSHYKELFRIPDGGKIKIRYSWNEERVRTCRYIDNYHVEIGNNLYHICEFAELVEHGGHTCEPVRDNLPERCHSTYETNVKSVSDFANEYGKKKRAVSEKER